MRIKAGYTDNEGYLVEVFTIDFPNTVVGGDDELDIVFAAAQAAANASGKEIYGDGDGCYFGLALPQEAGAVAEEEKFRPIAKAEQDEGAIFTFPDGFQIGIRWSRPLSEISRLHPTEALRNAGESSRTSYSHGYVGVNVKRGMVTGYRWCHSILGEHGIGGEWGNITEPEPYRL